MYLLKEGKLVFGHLAEFDHFYPIQYFDDRVKRIKFKLTNREIGPTAKLMMIVVQSFAKHDEVHRKQIAGSVLHLKIDVADTMRKPIDNHSMEWTHDRMDGNEWK